MTFDFIFSGFPSHRAATMSSEKPEVFLGLTNCELKLIVLGVLYNDSGKVQSVSFYVDISHSLLSLSPFIPLIIPLELNCQVHVD